MKAMFNGTTLWKNLPHVLNSIKRVQNNAKSSSFIVAQANSDGTDLENYSGDIDSMTVNSELNKLGANIALGRNWANVHYRSDGDWGMLIGEEVAINYLKDVLTIYNQTHAQTSPVELTLNKFDGSTITIGARVI